MRSRDNSVSVKNNGKLSIAMVGTRGVPAAYGGFETAIEEIGSRLVERGHEITVYCRRGNHAKRSGDEAATDPKIHHGMRLVHLPALRRKSLETLSHTAFSALHHVVKGRQDAVFVFNAANAPFVPAFRRGGAGVAVHVDGLEWKRAKWGPVGQKYYRTAEELSVRWADALIADAQGIADYYEHEFSVPTRLIAYGAPIMEDLRPERLTEVGVNPGQYHLAVARFEPENHVDVILEAYSRSEAKYPLVVVGSAPYESDHVARINQIAASDKRIKLLGGVWDQDLLDQLYAHSMTYLHGHSVGGTNPSLLRAMGAGAPTIAYDVVFNREVLGNSGQFFQDAHDLAAQLGEVETSPETMSRAGQRLQLRARENYDWDLVTDGYEELAYSLAAGDGLERSGVRKRRRDGVQWQDRIRTSSVGSRSVQIQDVRVPVSEREHQRQEKPTRRSIRQFVRSAQREER